MADNVDEFGIPIKTQPTVDEFGIPVKKKEETFSEDLQTPSAKPTMLSNQNGLEDKTDQRFREAQGIKLDFSPQQEQQSSTAVEQPFIAPVGEEIGDPLLSGGDALINQEEEVIKSRKENLARELFEKSMSREGRRGIPYTKEDIPKTVDEASVLEGAKKDYEVIIESKLYDHVPEDMKIKAKINLKQKQLYNQLKDGNLEGADRLEAMDKLKLLETELKGFDFGKKLFNPLTGDYIDQDKAPDEAVEYEDKVKQLVKTDYTDIQKTYKAAEKALLLYEHYEDEYNKPIIGDNGNPLVFNGKEISHKEFDKARNTGFIIPGVSESGIKKLDALKDRWINSKANTEAISRAIMLNEDPSQIKRGFLEDAGFSEALGKGFMEAVGQNEYVQNTDADYATRFVEVIRDSGEKGLLTKKQVESAEQTFTEKLGYGVGASLPIMAEIAVTTAATEGLGTIPVVASNLNKLRGLYGVSKAGKLLGNVVEQGAKGYITFAPTEETGATGIGEGVVQGTLDTFIPEKLIGGKYGKLLNYAIRTIGGASGETLQEVGGQYFNVLAENGYDATGTFEEAFGRTPEERWENLLLIGSTSLLFSGTFNARRLVATKEALQQEVEQGNVPKEDIEAVDEIVENINQKLESDSEQPMAKEETITEETKTKEDAISIEKTDEVSVQPETRSSEEVQKGISQPRLEEPTRKEEEIKPKEDAKPQLRIEEPTTQQDGGSVADIDNQQREEVKEETPTIKEEKPKGETFKYIQTRTKKGKKVKETITYNNVDKTSVLHKDKQGATLHESDRGFVSLNKSGKPQSQVATRKLIKEYQKDFDYAKGKEAEIKNAQDGEDADRQIAEKSNNPRELADLIDRRKEKETEAARAAQDTKEGAIAAVLSGKTVNPESYMANTGLKRKDVHTGILTHHFKAGGKPLDVLAIDAMSVLQGAESQTSTAEGIEITEQDIVEFLDKYPNTSNDYFKQFGVDETNQKARDKFRELTGFEPTAEAINMAKTQAKKETVATKESLIEELNNLPKGASTEAIAKKAKKLGLFSDNEFLNIISPKAKEHFAEQARLLKEFGIEQDFDEDIDLDMDEIDLPFQKTSRKQITGRQYAGRMINTLKKAMPGVKIEFDTNLDAAGTIRDGKVVINPKRVSSDTAVHEFAHIYVAILKQKNNALYKTGITLVSRDTELMDYIRNSRPDLKTEEQIAEEALVTAIGEKGSDTFNKRVEQNSKLQEWIRKMWNNVKQFFGIKRNITWREASEMTLKDFTKATSEELLNETPLTTLTQEDVNGIMSGDINPFESITIDSEILTQKALGRFKKAQEFTKGVFSSAGKMPKWVSNLDNNTRSAVNATLSKAAIDAKIFQNILKDHIKENKLDKKQVEELMLNINDVLAGDKTVNVIGLDQNEELALSIAAIRNNIDQLSEILISSGYIEGDIITTINENIGSYVRRSYSIHKTKPKSAVDWLSQLPEGVEQKAREFIKEQLALSKVSKIKFTNKDNGTYNVVLINEFGHESKSVLMSRGDLIAVLTDGQPKLTEGNIKELDIDEATVKLNENVNVEKYGIKFTPQANQITDEINTILSKHLGKDGVFGVAGLNKKDISILKKRKDIPKEIRDLLGEIKDPVANYMESISKMASYVEYSKFLNRLKEEGEGTLIWSKNDKPKGLDLVRISAENNPKWKPLDGMYTTKEFMDALQHFETDGLFDWNYGYLKAINSYAMYLNSFTKASLTKWNPGSNARNHIGAFLMAARLGYANPIKMAKAYNDYWKGISLKDKKNFDRQEFEMMQKYGMIDDGVGYQTYKESMERAVRSNKTIKAGVDWFNQTKLGKVASSPREFTDKFYLAPDAAVKMFLFRSMKEDYAKAYPNLTDEQLNEKVANIVKDTMPTYSKMSKGAKTLSRNPLIGAFASFTTETVRNTKNQIEIASKELKEGLETNNEELIKIARKKITGLVAASMFVPILSGVLKMMIGVSDEDDENLRTLRPDWEKNSWILYTNKGKDGSIGTTDLSYTDPMSAFSKPIRALYTGLFSDKIANSTAVADALGEVKDQFLGQEPLSGALMEAYTNRDRYGRFIAQPMKGTAFDRAKIRTGHVIDAMKPKIIDTFFDIKKVYDKEETDFGKKYDPTTFVISNLGVRFKKDDILKSMKFNIGGDFNYSNEDAEGVNAKNIFKYSEDKSQEDLDDANAKLSSVFKRHIQHIEAAKSTGATDKQIREALNQRRESKNGKKGTRYIPKYWVDQLLNKQFIPLTEDEGTLKPKFKRIAPKKTSTKQKRSSLL